MPKFNLADYETVEERIKRFYAEHPDGRITTELVSEWGEQLTNPRTWIFKASVYLSAGDQANGLAKATGYASEIDGTGGANNGSAAENAETSAIGRALANMNLSGNKRSSREEMQKVNRIEATDWMAEVEAAKDKDALRQLYTRARAQGASKEVLDVVKARAESLDSQDS
jgi:hypothetical protein